MQNDEGRVPPGDFDAICWSGCGCGSGALGSTGPGRRPAGVGAGPAVAPPAAPPPAAPPSDDAAVRLGLARQIVALRSQGSEMQLFRAKLPWFTAAMQANVRMNDAQRAALGRSEHRDVPHGQSGVWVASRSAHAASRFRHASW